MFFDYLNEFDGPKEPFNWNPKNLSYNEMQQEEYAYVNEQLAEKKISYDEWNADTLLTYRGYAVYAAFVNTCVSLNGREQNKRC